MIEIAGHYRAWLDPQEWERLVEAVGRPLPPAFRVNTLKISVEAAQRRWPSWYGWQVRPVSFCPAGWQITAGGEGLSRTLEHKMGCYYIQDVASMLPVELFDFSAAARPLVLDMAAAPGGKTTHLAARTDDAGLIVANDVSGGRMAALRTNLIDWGTTSAVVTSYPGERFGAWFPELFDYVLLDAPCSGEALRTAERRKGRPVSATERQALHKRQVRLLISAFQALKPGGQLVYATCSLHPEEDEAVIDTLLTAYPHQAALESVEHIVGVSARALASDGTRAFHPALTRAARLWPHIHDTAGFFAALISKRDAVPVPPQAPPRRSFAETGFRPLAQRETAALRSALEGWGFDLSAVLQAHALGLWKRDAVVYAIPDLLHTRLGELPFVAAGMVIGEMAADEFAPSHEFVARFGAQFSERRLQIDAEQARLWLAGQDLRGHEGRAFDARTVVLIEDEKGRVLGRGKVLAGRVRNLLPKRLIY
jgi:16S rRNA (cytosine1407-C5)-methyltransferase